MVFVLAAVGCSVGTQYAVKFLVDALAGGASSSGVWGAFIVLVSLIAADNLLWRIASWIASFAFVAVSGDLRRDLFRHLTGHAPSYFTDRMPGMLTSRITATSNAVYTVENMWVWNVLPPCAATVTAIVFVSTVTVTLVDFLFTFARYQIHNLRSPLRNLPGPPSQSLLHGNTKEIFEKGYTVAWDEWMSTYGKTFRFSGIFDVRPSSLAACAFGLE